MTDDTYKRKLTTIFSTDAVGYSRLMGDDEAATVRTIELYRKIISDLIAQSRGRVIDSPGDNLLAEFSSIVDAVQCAVAVQKELQSRNAELADNRKMEFRIGINLGDVIEEGDRIYGDGVNIAARLESLADPGGICISKTAFDHIESKLPLGYEYMGGQEVKNITSPVDTYKVIMDPRVTVARKLKKSPIIRNKNFIWGAVAVLFIFGFIGTWQFYLKQPSVEPASEEKMVFTHPAKPSIAVLPFDNISGDPDQKYFSNGISEDLITDLSKISGLLVISRMSSFNYKDKNVKVQQIAKELGVRYVLEGSVRKVKDRLRINAQLIDASTGHHLWADRYDGDMSDIFALQDNITGKIISALALKLTTGEQTALTDRGTENIQAYDSFLKGRQGYRLLTTAGFSEAKLHLEKAIELDPGFSRAYAALAVLYWKAVHTASPELREGLGLTSRAKTNAIRNKPQLLLKEAMKKPTALAHGLMSQIYLFRYQHDQALDEIERAVAMDPNDPELYAWMSHILWLIGKSGEAAESAKMGLRLDPNNPTAYLIHLARASIPDGDLEESLKVLKRAERLNPELTGSIALTESIIYGIQGRTKEAHAAYETFLKSRLSPVHNLNAILLHLNFADSKKLDRIADALIKAGAPGKPTDYYRIIKENRLNGHEVRLLLLGHKITGTTMSTGKQYWWEWSTDGKLKITGAYEDIGDSWIEGDVFFIQWENHFSGLPWGTIIYKNPDGSIERQNQYLMVSDMGSITPFTITE